MVGQDQLQSNLPDQSVQMFLGALINHNKFQHNSSTPSWSKFAKKFTIGITMVNVPKNRISSKRPFLMVLVQM